MCIRDRYDLYTSLENDNYKWWAEFEYYFSAAGRQTDKVKGYIFPREIKYLAVLAEDFSNYPADSQLIIENISWHRINQHLIPDWEEFKSNHFNIENTDIKFVSAEASPLSERLDLN